MCNFSDVIGLNNWSFSTTVCT